jgi:hypothetical protein
MDFFSNFIFEIVLIVTGLLAETIWYVQKRKRSLEAITEREKARVERKFRKYHMELTLVYIFITTWYFIVGIPFASSDDDIQEYPQIQLDSFEVDSVE